MNPNFRLLLAPGSMALVFVVVVLAGVASMSTVSAQDATPVAGESCGTILGVGGDDTACVTIIHASFGSPVVDVYLDGELVIEQLAFMDVTGYLPIEPGPHVIQVTPAGEGPEAAVIVVPDFSPEPGVAYEVAAIGSGADLMLGVFPVDLSPLPPQDEGVPVGTTRARAIHAVSDAPPVNVSVIAGDIADRVVNGLEFGDTSDYVEKTAGIYGILVDVSDLPIGSLRVDDVFFQEDKVYSVYAVGSVGSATLEVLSVEIDLSTGEATSRDDAGMQAQTTELVAAIQLGTCADASGEITWVLEGEGHLGAGGGVIVPWGGEKDEISGADSGVPVLYGNGVAKDATFDQMLNRAIYSLVVTESASGETVACGDIGGVVVGGERLWEHAKLAIGMRAVDDGTYSGTATFVEDRGILENRVHVTVSLIEE